MNRLQLIVTLALAATLSASCVQHRPTRNGLNDEHVYLDKSDLTSDGWLFKITTVAASSPNVVGDWAFPGFESDVRYVRFGFKENKLQVLDGQQLQWDDPADPNDDLGTSVDRVMLEFDGQHVDVKLRESLDGERTNWLEENTELPWAQRQSFRVDFETSSLDPITQIAWFYGDYLHDCASITSINMVPDSFEWDKEGGHLTFVLEVNYQLNMLTYFGGCWDMISLLYDAGNASIHYRFSFLQRPTGDFPVQVIAEKDPVNKKYGAFQNLLVWQDPESGNYGGKSLLQRWNPNRSEPVVFYFHKNFPPRFKPAFDAIEAQTNAALEASGASLRFDFRDYNHDGVERQFGDLRYSFVVWHQDIDTTRGLLGYGPSAVDPRTGEVISATVNLYNIGMDYYRFLIEDYLEEYGVLTKPAGQEATPWDQIPCSFDDIQTGADTLRLNTPLWDSMRYVMEQPPVNENPIDDFVPTPTRPLNEFLGNYQRLLGELRYGDPGWNSYTWRPDQQHPAARLPELHATEAQFQDSMNAILMNQNPFGPQPLYSLAGIERQNQFMEDVRTWRKAHEQYHNTMAQLLASKCIAVFEEGDAITTITRSARNCVDRGGGVRTWESDEDYSERIIANVVGHVAQHEFGHTISLRHNFYGSVDRLNMRSTGGVTYEVTSSVMDYVYAPEEAGSPIQWGLYDEAAIKWIYGTPAVRDDMMALNFLYCTDEHASYSPLCTRHDLGYTPSQIVVNAIERYEWQYDLRNRRAWRTFWDTSAYVSRVYSATFPLQRMWYLGIFDWGGGGIQSTLKTLDQLDPARPVLTPQQYDEIAADFNNDVIAANSLMMAFYDAVLNQPASYRNYQTEFDPYYGDILRLGIIIDKLFATFAFMDLQEVWNYDPNIYTYVAMYDAPYGTRNYGLSLKVLDSMLGASYATFPWFLYTALNYYAYVTNTNLIGDTSLRERIAIQRYDDLARFEAAWGHDAYLQVSDPENVTRTFIYQGEQYIYTFVEDRSWHLVASKSRNPVSYKYIKDYNEALNSQAAEELDNYGLKILLAYYEYYNNFQGF